jgi:hypothetical protein
VTTAAQLAERAGLDPRSPADPDAWGGKLNIYTCEVCRAHIVTRDVDEGVTPFMLPSKDYCPNKCTGNKPGGAHMTSSFYRVWNQSMREDYQWYKPESWEHRPAAVRAHLDKGGLDIRRAL